MNILQDMSQPSMTIYHETFRMILQYDQASPTDTTFGSCIQMAASHYSYVRKDCFLFEIN